MKYPEPLELLIDKLNELEKALHKSFMSFNTLPSEISEETHKIHKANLEPLIFKYKQAIKTLENWSQNIY